MNKVDFWFKSFFRSFSELPESVPSKHYRYYVVGGYSYFCCLVVSFLLYFHILFDLRKISRHSEYWQHPSLDIHSMVPFEGKRNHQRIFGFI